MRTSFRPEFVIENDEVVGFYFDNGACAEHEHGIKDLVLAFGIQSKELGYERRLITRGSEQLLFFKYKSVKIDRACLMFEYDYYNVDMNDKKSIRKHIESCPIKVKSYTDETEWISAAWSYKDFAIYAAGKENAEKLELIYNAFKENDIVMFVGNPSPNNPFSRGGLTFLIASKLTDEFKKLMYDSDLDQKNLEKAASRIIKKVDRAGLKYYALIPHWADEEKKKLKFWLNPQDQQNNYFGWVTPQDLKDWIKGKGFIPGHGFKFERENKEEYNRLIEERRSLF